jgi:hypothetical protein
MPNLLDSRLTRTHKSSAVWLRAHARQRPDRSQKSDDRSTGIRLYVRLITNGQPISGATATGVAHYKSKPTNLGPALTGSDGVAQIDFDISRATIGYTVFIDITVVGQTVTDATNFTPQ